MNTARSPVGRTENATGDFQIETSFKHGITHFLQLVTKPQRENVGTLLSYYERMNIIGRLPISLSIKMNSYGLVTRKNRIPTAAMQVAAEAFIKHARL